MFKRCLCLLTALCLALPLCLGFGGCSVPTQTGSGLAVPEGMVDATPIGNRFAFFIPSGWTAESSTGVLQATVSVYSSANVTAVAFPSERSLEEYWLASRDEIAAKFKDGFKVEEFNGAEGEKVLMDGAAALRYKYSGTYYTDVAVNQDMYMTKKDGYIYVLTYTAAASEYAAYTSEVASIVENFRFLTPAESTPTPPATDTEGAPEGMHNIAIADYNAYRFYIPTSWTVDMQTGITSAYVSDTDRSSVSLSCYYPSNASVTSIETYWDALQKSYKALYTDYAVTDKPEKDEKPTKIAGLDGATYVFTGRNGGTDYRVMQVFFIRGSYIYTFTYTATEAAYESHLAEVNRIMEAITF